jgi:hypothetical protein
MNLHKIAKDFEQYLIERVGSGLSKRKEFSVE